MEWLQLWSKLDKGLIANDPEHGPMKIYRAIVKGPMITPNLTQIFARR